MSFVGMVLAGILALYLVTGLVTALAFLVFGVSRVPHNPTPVTIGARILLFPGAVLLWPAVLGRWLQSFSAP